MALLQNMVVSWEASESWNWRSGGRGFDSRQLHHSPTMPSCPDRPVPAPKDARR